MTIPLSIAFVSREYPPFFGGGIGTYARWIVPALSAQGARVHVITQAYDQTQPRIEVDGNTTVHRLPVGMGAGGWPNAALRFSINAGRLIASLYRAGRVQIAEFAECEAAGLATLACNRNRPASIVQLHTPSEQLFVLRSLSTQTLDVPHRVYFESERLAMHLADEILAPSQFIASWARKQYGFKLAPSVIPYATGQLPPPPEGTPTGQAVFYAGRIEPRKGVESLILAFNEVARMHPDATLRLAGADTSSAPGGGSMRAYLQSLIQPHAQRSVLFLGRLDRMELEMEYTRASLCVIPSLWENFPNTCIESMSYARAVLVSDQGGMQEMVGDTDAGRTFTAGDSESLARVMNEMLSEPVPRRLQRGRAARSRIEYLCNPDRVARERIKHYHKVIEGKEEANTGRNRAGTLNAWRGLEASMMGDAESFSLPTISTGVQRWVERYEEYAC